MCLLFISLKKIWLIKQVQIHYAYPLPTPGHLVFHLAGLSVS